MVVIFLYHLVTGPSLFDPTALLPPRGLASPLAVRLPAPLVERVPRVVDVEPVVALLVGVLRWHHA